MLMIFLLHVVCTRRPRSVGKMQEHPMVFHSLLTCNMTTIVEENNFECQST
jgi:hypothetical protein